ncbi:MAG: hypothetical protein R6V59_01160 [Dehalococcoidia bacterium]
MAEKGKRYPNPRFQSVEEEVAYWDRHSPITEGYEGRLQRGHQKRDSFLAVRLSAEELERLRDVADRKGVGPSTLARSMILAAIAEGGLPARVMTMPEFQGVIEKVLQQKLNPDTLSEMLETYKSMAIGDPASPTLVIADQEDMRKLETFSKSLVLVLLQSLGIHVVTDPTALGSYRTLSTQESQATETA